MTFGELEKKCDPVKSDSQRSIKSIRVFMANKAEPFLDSNTGI